MRALIHFPIIHSFEDLGSFRQLASESRTEEQIQQIRSAVEHFWTMVASSIESIELNYENLKIYQDGLPICGRELDIVNNVAASGSQNYKLLQLLHQKGATIMGSESPELLLQEFNLIKQRLKSEEQQAILLNQRDDYIAQRINSTLHDGEMGILFLGAMHNIDAKLAKDITLINLFGKP